MSRIRKGFRGVLWNIAGERDLCARVRRLSVYLIEEHAVEDMDVGVSCPAKLRAYGLRLMHNSSAATVETYLGTFPVHGLRLEGLSSEENNGSDKTIAGNVLTTS